MRNTPQSIAEKYVDQVRKAGIRVSEAYLFGSAAQNQNYHDIDIAIVSSAFVQRYDIGISQVDDSDKMFILVEPHPIPLSDISWSPFYAHVKETGIWIA